MDSDGILWLVIWGNIPNLLLMLIEYELDWRVLNLSGLKAYLILPLIIVRFDWYIKRRERAPQWCDQNSLRILAAICWRLCCLNSWRWDIGNFSHFIYQNIMDSSAIAIPLVSQNLSVPSWHVSICIDIIVVVVFDLMIMCCGD